MGPTKVRRQLRTREPDTKKKLPEFAELEMHPNADIRMAIAGVFQEAIAKLAWVPTVQELNNCLQLLTVNQRSAFIAPYRIHESGFHLELTETDAAKLLKMPLTRFRDRYLEAVNALYLMLFPKYEAERRDRLERQLAKQGKGITVVHGWHG